MADIYSDNPLGGPLDSSGISESTDANIQTGGHGVDDEPDVSILARLLKNASWVLFALACLGIFTLFKLPEDRIRAYVQGTINAQLASKGITLTATQSFISAGLGLTYTMKDVTLSFPQPSTPAKLEEISVSPSLISLLIGNIGGSALINTKGGGRLNVNFSTPRNPKAGTSPLSLDADIRQIDLGSLGILDATAGVRGGAVVSGNVVLKGDFMAPSTLEGHTHLDLTHIVIDSQNVMGFTLPRIAVAEGTADFVFEKGKMLIKTFKLGKSPSDDIRATITGDLTLGRTWPQSTLNAKADFSLSDTILKNPSLSLVDALLAQGKKPDNSYSYNLNGPLNSLAPSPAK
jgi:type II secretion system protein N